MPDRPSPRTARPDPLGAIARFSLRHRWFVVIFWGVMLLAGGTAAGKVQSRLTFDFSLPGQPGYVAAQKILATYHNGGESDATLLVVTPPSGQSISSQLPALASAFEQVRRRDPALRVLDYGDTGNRLFVTAGGASTFAMVFPPVATGFSSPASLDRATGIVQRAVPHGDSVAATGLDQLSNSSTTKGQSVLAETMLGGVGALIVLLFVFGSLLAFLPMLVAAVSITTTFLVVLGLTYVTSISFVVEFLVALVGLGVAIDYSLLVVTRWREERHHGRDNTEAVVVAMSSAGRAVVFSGITVGIALLSMVVLPVPGLRSIGIGGMLIPLMSVLVTSTLLPAVLGGVGPRIDWPRIRHEAQASKPWSAWARAVVRRRWFAAGATLVVLGVMIVPFFSMKVGLTGPQALAKAGSARTAYNTLLGEGVPSGVLTPMEVLVQTSAVDRTAAVLAHQPGIASVAVPSASDSRHDGTTVLIAVPSSATLNSSEAAVVTRTRSALAPVAGVIGIAGVGATQLDYVHAVFGNFPLMLVLIALLTFLLLARAFRSVLLPLKAVILNLVSLSATFGLVTWFWQEGHGSHALFGIPATGAITFWVPLMIFAFLFGLSMDYEVFILARVREEYDRTGSTDRAVVEGLARTGRLVTSAALILFLAFASLASASFTDLKVFATALGAGILLDATLVRALLLPALVSLFGKWNWYMPSWFARVLRVTEHGGIHGPIGGTEGPGGPGRGGGGGGPGGSPGSLGPVLEPLGASVGASVGGATGS